MFNRKFKIIIAAGLSFTLLSGFGLKDITKELGPDTDNCEKSPSKSKSKNEEYLKSAAKIAAVTVAAAAVVAVVVLLCLVEVGGGDIWIILRYAINHDQRIACRIVTEATHANGNLTAITE